MRLLEELMSTQVDVSNDIVLPRKVPKNARGKNTLSSSRKRKRIGKRDDDEDYKPTDHVPKGIGVSIQRSLRPNRRAGSNPDLFGSDSETKKRMPTFTFLKIG